MITPVVLAPNSPGSGNSAGFSLPVSADYNSLSGALQPLVCDLPQGSMLLPLLHTAGLA